MASTPVSADLEKSPVASTSTLHPFEDEAIEDLNIPTRILSNDANLEEYRHETPSGVILQTHLRKVDGYEEKVKYKLVTKGMADSPMVQAGRRRRGVPQVSWST